MSSQVYGDGSIQLLPSRLEVQLSTATNPGFTYELQSSHDLGDWLAITSSQAGDGNTWMVVQPLTPSLFYRFLSIEIETTFAPDLFPFDQLEAFEIVIPGFEVEMHTDPTNFIGVRGEMTYSIRPSNPNTADLLIRYTHYTTRNSESGDSTERTPEQEAAATAEIQIKEILISYLFNSPTSGSSTTVYTFTDDSKENFVGEFEIQ
jgi:hypothetical protein